MTLFSCSQFLLLFQSVTHSPPEMQKFHFRFGQLCLNHIMNDRDEELIHAAGFPILLRGFNGTYKKDEEDATPMYYRQAFTYCGLSIKMTRFRYDRLENMWIFEVREWFDYVPMAYKRGTSPTGAYETPGCVPFFKVYEQETLKSFCYSNGSILLCILVVLVLFLFKSLRN